MATKQTPGIFGFKRKRGEPKDIFETRMRETNSAQVNKYSWTPSDGRGVRQTVASGKQFAKLVWLSRFRIEGLQMDATEQTTESVLVETPAAAPDPIQALIDEFERSNPQPEPEPAADPSNVEAPAPQADPFDQQIADILGGPDPRISELQTQVDAAANRELQAVQRELSRTTDPAKIAELQQYGYRLQVAIASPAILRKASLNILNEARSLKPPIDEEATADRNMVAQAIRDSGAGKGIPVEPPPSFGTMTDSELRDYTKKNFGFA